MTFRPDDWSRVKEIFHAALEQDVQQRKAFVARACDGDAAMQSEIERLLTAHDDADQFLEQRTVNEPSSGGLTGERLGRYEIGRLLGAGGMGEVYAAYDVDLRRDVAIKVALDDEAGSRLRREAQHASRLNHPHICTIHEVGSSDARSYIAMEYVAGSALRDLVPPEGMPLQDVVRFGTQIADALAHAHEQGIIHRDLKTANVMVTPDGRAKVLDFGLARRILLADASGLTEATLTSTMPGAVMGTLACMAPELLRGEQAGVRTDIWAFGVLLYELACGARPFDGRTGFELTSSILQQPVPRSPRIAVSLHRIIEMCLARNPDDRYVSVREIGAALATLPVTNSASTQSAGSHTGRLRWWRTSPAYAALAAFAVVAAIVGVVAWRSMRAGEPVGLGASGRPAIAVMTFDNLAAADEAAWLSQGVPNMLLTGLAQTRGLDIISLQRLREVARQMGGTDLESVRRDQFAELARRAGAGVMVIGGIARSGTEIRIDAQVEDVTTGRILTAQSVRGSDVFALVDQLAAQIRDDVGLRTADGVRLVADISTDSLDAYRLYAQGVQAFENYHWDAAQPLLERAVALDPSFADAYLHLAHVNFFLDRPALQQEYLRRASEHVNKLGARQRLVLAIEQARDAGDGPAAARTLDQLLETFPDEENAYNITNQLYNPVTGLVYDPQKFLIITARGAAALPASTLTHNLYAYALLIAGRHDEALAEFRRNVERAPREPNPHDSLGEGMLRAGDPVGALESYGRALTIDPQFGSQMGRAWAFGMLGRYDEALAESPPANTKAFLLSRVGRYREAALLIDEGRRQAEVVGNVAEQGQLWLLSALIAIERRDYSRALEGCDAAERLFMRLPEPLRRVRLGLFHTLKGLALVSDGKIADARTHATAAERLLNPVVEPEKYWLTALTGEIALASGDFAEAATAYSSGEPAQKMWFDAIRMSLTALANNFTARDGLARVARAQGNPSRAIEIYRDLLAPGLKQKFVAVFEPRYVLEIARLLEHTGDRRGALQEYQRFQGLWSRADADEPEVGEARRAVARLSR